MAVFFLDLQAVIGAAQVLWGQGDFILALHFGISLISFASVFLLTLLIFEIDRTSFMNRKYGLEIIKFAHYWRNYLFIFCHLYWCTCSAYESGLICSDWPCCSNEFSLPNNMYEWIQMGHRLAAALIVVWIGFIAIKAIKHYSDQRCHLLGLDYSVRISTCRSNNRDDCRTD